MHDKQTRRAPITLPDINSPRARLITCKEAEAHARHTDSNEQ